MRIVRLAVCIGVSAMLAHVAIAQPADDAGKEPYPIELVDRPLVLPRGATELSVNELFRTYLQTMTDANGIETREREWDYGPGFSIGHVFGPIEVSIDVQDPVQLRFDMLVPEQPIRVSLTTSTLAPQRDGRYHIDQVAYVTYKRAVIPHRLALLAGASVVLAETRIREAGQEIEGVYVRVGAGGTAEVQVARRVCISAGASIGGYVYQSAPFGFHGRPSASLTITFLLRRWDFFVDSHWSIESAPAASAFVGFTKRWGI